MSKKERRLAAIMFTDIVGYSSMMQKDEAYAGRMRTRHRQIFNRWHKQYRGKVLQYYGDGTLSIFNSTTDAVECAVAIQQSLKSNPKVPIRIGIHIGDITYSDEEVYGDGVNIAARIESICVPGGVFISGKTYDDIRNHSSLKAKSIGYFPLKNIQDEIEVYAITNEGITAPDYEWKPVVKSGHTSKFKSRETKLKGGKKSKWIAALLAFFFGIFGVHRFYLEQKLYGILFLGMFFLGLISGFEQFTAIPAILGFIDFITFLFMPRETFNAKYNKEILEKEEIQRKEEESEARNPKKLLGQQYKKYVEEARTAYTNFEFETAIEHLQKAIELKYDEWEAHFLLARCYSINEDVANAFAHLEAAVAFGLPPEQIKTHDDLAFLRIQPGFEVFKANNYVIPRGEISSSDILELKEPDEPDLLEQLNRLQKEFEADKLTEKEYQERQKELIPNTSSKKKNGE